MPKRFRFRLEPVLSVRRIEEDHEKRAFGEASRRAEEQTRRVEDIGHRQVEAREAFARTRARAIHLGRLRLEEGYLLGLARRVRREGTELIKRIHTREERRKEFIEARKKVRVLEQLRDRRLRDYRREVGREEQKILDETSLAYRGVRRKGEES